MNTKRFTLVFVLILLLIVIFVLLFRDPTQSAKASTGEVPQQKSLSQVNAKTVDFDELTVRKPVFQLTGLLGEDRMDLRYAALGSLPEDLNPKELETIYTGVLENPRPEAFASRAWHAFFNDVLNALVLEQKKPVTELPDRLMAILQNEGRHRVIRDYALQHLLAFAEYRMDDASRVVLLEAAWEAIADTRDSFRGTYLVAISYKAGEPGWLSKKSVAQKAWEVAAAGEAHVLSRITALQVCGRLGHMEALPLALEIAGDPKAHMTLRTSAIATIGDLGSRAEWSFLNDLNQRVQPRLKVAISIALHRLEGKNESI